jgi:hypothetical protein
MPAKVVMGLHCVVCAIAINDYQLIFGATVAVIYLMQGTPVVMQREGSIYCRI